MLQSLCLPPVEGWEGLLPTPGKAVQPRKGYRAWCKLLHVSANINSIHTNKAGLLSVKLQGHFLKKKKKKRQKRKPKQNKTPKNPTTKKQEENTLSVHFMKL